MVNAYAHAVAITPSDTVNLPAGFTDAIFAGGAGTIVVVMQSDVSVSFPVAAGQILPIKAKRVGASSTATAMIALYW